MSAQCITKCASGLRTEVDSRLHHGHHSHRKHWHDRERAGTAKRSVYSDLPAALGEATGWRVTYEPYGNLRRPGRGARLTLTFVSESGHLAVRPPGAQNPARYRYAGNDTFVRSREIITFIRDSAKVVGVRVDRVYQNTVLTKRPN